MPLGKNLENILGDYFGEQGIDLTSSPTTQVIEVDIATVKRNPHQTRKHFEASKIISLARNIDKNGLINPITILRDEKDQFMLIAGERRLRAYQELGLTKIPAIIRDYKAMTDTDKFLLSASENLQRENLNPIELTKTFKILIDTHNWSLRDIGQSIGASAQYVLNYLNLLALDEKVQEAVGTNIIGEAHARRLIPLPAPKQVEFLDLIIRENLSIRALSDLVNDELNKDNKLQDSNSTWINNIPKKHYSNLEKWAETLPKSRIKAKGDENRGKIVITWGGYSE